MEHLSPTPGASIPESVQSLPMPDTEAYEALPQFPKRSPLPAHHPATRAEADHPAI